jgi:hypothetical protein
MFFTVCVFLTVCVFFNSLLFDRLALLGKASHRSSEHKQSHDDQHANAAE